MNITQDIDYSVSSNYHTEAVNSLNKTTYGFMADPELSAIKYSSGQTQNTSQQTVPNTADGVANGDQSNAFSRSELIMLQSIVQGNKIARVTSNIRSSSRFRSKKRARNKLKKSGAINNENPLGLDVYKEHPNDLTSAKAAMNSLSHTKNLSFKRTLVQVPKAPIYNQGRRNMSKVDMNLSESAKKKRMQHNLSKNDTDLKLKKYIDLIYENKSEFDDFFHNELYTKITNQILTKQEYKKFVGRCQRFQEVYETLGMMSDMTFSAVALQQSLEKISKNQNLDENIPNIVEILPWI